MRQDASKIVPQVNTGTGGADKGGPKKPDVPKPDTAKLLKQFERVPLSKRAGE